MKAATFIYCGMNSRTTPMQKHAVRGLPETVCIYQIGASKFWQFRFFMEDKYVRKSTKETEIPGALAKAKEFYKDALLKQRNNIPVHTTTFLAVSKRFSDLQKSKEKQKGTNKRTYQEDHLKLKKDILPFFEKMDVSLITKRTIENYLSAIAERDLSKSTLNRLCSGIKLRLSSALA